MSDMNPVIEARSDQLNAADLVGGPITITITKVDVRPDAKEQPVSVHYQGDNGKPWKPCKGMSRVMVAAWGPDSKTYPGKCLTLFCDPTVKWAGMEIGGIRISHMSDIPGVLLTAVTLAKGSRKPYKVEPLQGGQGDDGAQELADDLIRRVRGAAKIEALNTLRAKIGPRLDWLRDASPRLYDKVGEAIEACEAALAGADTITPDNPTAAEGPADDDRGEAHSDEPHPAQAAVDAYLKRILNAVGRADVEMAIMDFSAHKAGLPDDMRDEVDAAEHNRLMRFSTAAAG